MATEGNGYRLRAAEMKLVETLNNPENVGKNVTELCNLAGISRKTYYKLMKNEKFVEAKNKIAIDCLKGKIEQVINATYKFAIGNSKCSNDRKVLLTMAGMYADKQEVESNNKNDNTVTIKLEGDLKEWAK